MNAVHDFIATLISDSVMRERVFHVFSALPDGAQEEFMGDPGFVIGIYDTGRLGGSGLLIPCPRTASPISHRSRASEVVGASPGASR